MTEATLFDAISGDSLIYSSFTYNLGLLLPRTQNKALLARFAISSVVVFLGYFFVWAFFLHNFSILLPQLPLPIITFLCGLFDTFEALECRIKRVLSLFKRGKNG